MEPLGRGLIRFRVHGPDTATDEVSAGIFSRQLNRLFLALQAADRAVNGRKHHDYVIAKLSSSAPMALLRERPIPRYRGRVPLWQSGIEAFEDCADAVKVGAEDRAGKYAQCVKHISKFSEDGYSEIWTKDDTVFRVDSFLIERAKEVMERPTDHSPSLLKHDQAPTRAWYKGTAEGSFDGTVKVADMRGALPQITLVLTAGGAEIECICRDDDKESIRVALDRRARVYGRAIYDGKRGLPRRIEVRKIEVLDQNRDFTRWKGAFEPFEIASDWLDEEA